MSILSTAVLALWLGLSSSTYASEPVKVRMLHTEEENAQAHCWNSPESKDLANCGYNDRKKIILIYLPFSLGQRVLRHLEEARVKGYFDDISGKDLFHGHFIPRGPQMSFDSPEAFFAGTSPAILYHSAEFNQRWGKEIDAGIPLEKRRTRSFLGWDDGAVEPAIDLINRSPKPPRLFIYKERGTIFTDEVVSAQPDLSSLKKIGELQDMRKFRMKACEGENCRECGPSYQFLLVHDEGGRFTTKAGERLEFVLTCYYDNEKYQ